jgi:4-amino-4-deoxy-L-arabinose transferase-like glycosyltransferase
MEHFHNMPQSQSIKQFLLFFAIFIGICAIYTIGLGKSPLLDPDEPIYGQFVKEMVNSGDWLTPHYDDKLWFDKPPLFYWLASSCVKIGGLNEFTLRLPSAIFGALTVLMVFFLACHDFGKKAGALAAAVVSTTLLQIVLTHAAATDALMVFFMVAGLYFYRRWLDETSIKATLWMAACGAAAGLGLLTKGPSVPLLLFVAIVAHLLWIKKLRKLISVDILLGVVVSLVIGLPWYLAMWSMYGQIFIDQFIIANNVTRFTEPLHKSHLSHWYSYLTTVELFLAFFFPWNVYMLQAIWSKWRLNTGAKLATCWMVAVLLLFSASSTQNFTYSFPAFPACAILVGAYLAGLADEKSGKKKALIGLWIGFVIASLVAITLFIIAKDKYPALLGPSALAGAILVMAYAIPLVSVTFFKYPQERAPWMVAIGMVAFNFMVACVLAPLSANYESTKIVAEHINSAPPARVAAYNVWKPGLLYYLNSKPMDVKTLSEVESLIQSKEPVLVLCHKNDANAIEQYSLAMVFEGGGLKTYANPAYMKTLK